MNIETLKESIINLVVGATNCELLELVHRFAKKILG